MTDVVGGPIRPPGARSVPSGAAIDRLRVSVLEVPLGEAVPMSIGALDARHACLVEVAADGVWGVGETWVNHPGWAVRERLLTYRHGVAPLALGRDIADPSALLTELARKLLPRAEQAGAAGPVWQALSGLDLALWDLLGKLHGCSVATLLAPDHEHATSVDVYASGVGPTLVEELCSIALGQGVSAVKARVGFGVETDSRTLRTIRSSIADDVLLFADANRAWTPDEATAMASVLREFGVVWIEEPLRYDPPEVLAALAQGTGLPVAVGENLYGVDAFASHLASGQLALVQPDVAKSGGLSTVAAVTEAAAGRRVPVSPHCYSGGVSLAASVLLASAFDNVPIVELDVRPNPLRTHLLDERWDVVDGRVTVPSGPGLGVTLAPETLGRYLIAQEEFTVQGAMG